MSEPQDAEPTGNRPFVPLEYIKTQEDLDAFIDGYLELAIPEDMRDAARYRFIREETNRVRIPSRLLWMSAKDMDRAIDAAMGKEHKS